MGVEKNRWWQFVSSKGIPLTATKKIARYCDKLNAEYQATPRQRKQYKIVLTEYNGKMYVKLFKRRYYGEIYDLRATAQQEQRI